MNYFMTVNGQPPFTYTDLDLALMEAREAVERRFFHKLDKEGSSLWIQLGPGSVIALVSEDEIKEKHKEQVEIQQRAQGLIVPRRDTADWKLVIQLPMDGTVKQLPPLDFDTCSDAEQFVGAALNGGVVHHVVQREHDYLWVFPSPGTAYMIMHREQLELRQRLAVEAMQREARARVEAARVQGEAVRKIIL